MRAYSLLLGGIFYEGLSITGILGPSSTTTTDDTVAETDDTTVVAVDVVQTVTKPNIVFILVRLPHAIVCSCICISIYICVCQASCARRWP
jgi:hypothetical protein